MPHAPLLHPAVAWGGARQLLPQRPQLNVSEAVSTQAPLQQLVLVPASERGQSASLTQAELQANVPLLGMHRWPLGQLSLSGRQATHFFALRLQRGVGAAHCESSLQPDGM